MTSRKLGLLKYGVSAIALTVGAAAFGADAQTIQGQDGQAASLIPSVNQTPTVIAFLQSNQALNGQGTSTSTQERPGQGTSGSQNILLAQAQPAAGAPVQSAQNVETVTVTGVEASVSGALNIKQNSGQMVDAIVSEDIGKLPDVTVVTALQHVTGVSILLNSVEPSTVLIRGLPYVQTPIDGREIFTSTGRALSLPDIPAELLARVDVDKTSTASDLEGGIAGLIDIRFHRPFDFDGFEFAATGQTGYETLAQHIDPDLSALVSNRWNTDIGEIGLLLDVAYKDTHTRSDEMVNHNSYLSNVVGPVPAQAQAPEQFARRRLVPWKTLERRERQLSAMRRAWHLVTALRLRRRHSIKHWVASSAVRWLLLRSGSRQAIFNSLPRVSTPVCGSRRR